MRRRDVGLHPAGVVIALVPGDEAPAGALALVGPRARVHAARHGQGVDAVEVVGLALAVVDAAVDDEPLAVLLGRVGQVAGPRARGEGVQRGRGRGGGRRLGGGPA